MSFTINTKGPIEMARRGRVNFQKADALEAAKGVLAGLLLGAISWCVVGAVTAAGAALLF